MTIAEIQAVLGAKSLVPGRDASTQVTGAIASDMLSDVLSFALPGCILLTGCTNPQTVRTAELADLAGVCYVQQKTPGPDSVALAREKGITLLVTGCGLYEACGRLHAAGLPACGPRS
jgi:hypothetical protein